MKNQLPILYIIDPKKQKEAAAKISHGIIDLATKNNLDFNKNSSELYIGCPKITFETYQRIKGNSIKLLALDQLIDEEGTEQTKKHLSEHVKALLEYMAKGLTKLRDELEVPAYEITKSIDESTVLHKGI